MNLHETYQNLVAKEKVLEELLKLIEEYGEGLEVSFRLYINGEGRVHELPRAAHDEMRKRVTAFVALELPLLLEEYNNAYGEAVKDFVASAVNNTETRTSGKADFASRIDALKQRSHLDVG